ncbi:MAG: TetR/AcrR family transcriptional regulator [Pseudonocardia sp.]
MVRPRFARLDPEQQQAILRAALDEFATRGYRDASLNRVIDAAGVSKGSMYYYFEGKADLYAHVARVELGRLFDELGPFPVPDTGPDAYWSALRDHYRDLVTALTASPQLLALVRGWLAASEDPALQQVQQELERPVLPWIEGALATGQRIGAVRTDLPSGLLVAVVVGMGRAMDVWLLTRPPDESSPPDLINALVDMMRRALAP